MTEKNKIKKAGLFFGSFNPIHTGHLVIANYMLEFTDLDDVWLVISPHNPLKEKKSLLADNHRYYMVQLAIEDNPRLKASNIEFKLPQPSYTIDTLAYLGEKYPDNQFVLIAGTDLIGDGVNVAARIQHLAQPGEVCISASVHALVKNQPDLDFDDLGRIAVKNSYRRNRPPIPGA